MDYNETLSQDLNSLIEDWSLLYWKELLHVDPDKYGPTPTLTLDDLAYLAEVFPE